MNEWPKLLETLDRALSEKVPQGSKIIFLDYPVHNNIGDLLIYLGTEQWIEKNKLVVIGRWNCRNFSFPAIPPETIIVCHGGGNFGDLYPTHQLFRERVISRYLTNKIIILPQTVFFQTQSSLVAAARAISRHNGCHIFTRDPRSADIANKAFDCSVSMAPDMACYLYPLQRNLGLAETLSYEHCSLFLLRTDKEAIADQFSIAPGVNDWIGDWNDLLGYRLLPSMALARANVRYSRVFGSQNFASIWKRSAHRLVVSAAERFLKAQRIVTSRLHGYIMARLLEREAVIIDNSYGKNSQYIGQWHDNR
jgi:pyruvyl transferase EpsO